MPFDMLGQLILDFSVPGNRLFLAVSWIEINIMLRAVAIQHSVRRHEFADQLAALHTAISFI